MAVPSSNDELEVLLSDAIPLYLDLIDLVLEEASNASFIGWVEELEFHDVLRDESWSIRSVRVGVDLLHEGIWDDERYVSASRYWLCVEVWEEVGLGLEGIRAFKFIKSWVGLRILHFW